MIQNNCINLKSNEIIKRELSSFAGLLILKGERFVALACAFFQFAKHVTIGKQKETSESKQVASKLLADC